MDALKDQTFKDYTYPSRYAGVPYYYHTTDQRYVYGTTGHISKDTANQLYITKKGDTLDNLALYFYGSPLFYWAIADFNDIQDTFIPLALNTPLKIPTLTAITIE